jgi:hypothetical protein
MKRSLGAVAAADFIWLVQRSSQGGRTSYGERASAIHRTAATPRAVRQRAATALSAAWLTHTVAVAGGQAVAARPTLPTSPDKTDLQVEVTFADGQWIGPRDAVEIRLNRPIGTTEGRLAVVIDRTDWTGLFARSEFGLTYAAGVIPLPTGEHQVTIYLVPPTEDWQELRRATLRVLSRSGPDRAEAKPALDVNNKGQLAQDNFPVQSPAVRETYQDFTVNAGLRTTLVRNGWTTQAEANIIGVTNRDEALRGPAAPQFDLSNYAVRQEHAIGRIVVGHATVGAHRHLLNQFTSRGVTGMVRFGRIAELVVGGVNGTSIVGWSNFFGLNRRDHQVLSGVVGFELVPDRPGGLRVETTWMNGTRLPVSNFNQTNINDAEVNRGLGIRVVGVDARQRFRVDAGYSRSAFNHPHDPLLAPAELSLVPLVEETRHAQYFDASYTVLPGVKVWRSAQATLAAAFRHERIDPLYGTVGAQIRPDALQNAIELNGSIGQLTSQVTYTRLHDNLDAVASILTTRTRTIAWKTAVPLAPAAVSSKAGGWLPIISYSLARTHQLADGFPVNGGFNDPSQVPNQLSTNHLVDVSWQGANWRAGYQLNRSFQDNRQVGRTLSDFLNLTNSVSLAVVPHRSVDLSGDFGFDRADNRELVRVDATRRLNITGTWRIGRSSVTGALGAVFLRTDGNTGESRSTTLNLQVARTVAFWKQRSDWLQGQLFIRYARQSTRALARLFGIDTDQRLWTINSGLTLKVF